MWVSSCPTGIKADSSHTVLKARCQSWSSRSWVYSPCMKSFCQTAEQCLMQNTYKRNQILSCLEGFKVSYFWGYCLFTSSHPNTHNTVYKGLHAVRNLQLISLFSRFWRHFTWVYLKTLCLVKQLCSTTCATGIPRSLLISSENKNPPPPSIISLFLVCTWGASSA